MNRSLILLMALGGIAGCGGDSAPPPDKAGGQAQTDVTTPAGRNNAAKTALPTAIAKAGADPDGAKHTIYVNQFTGGGHEQLARAEKERLIRLTGRSDFWIMHKSEGSQLFFGYYRAIGDNVAKSEQAETQRAARDLKLIKSFRDSTNTTPYARSLLVPLPTPDPAAPPEWNLVNIDRDRRVDDPDRRYWSIAIAAYTNDASGMGADKGKDRKQLAVESVAAARKAGVEAYYFHGENVSTVCIGAWQRKAVQSQAENDANPNRINAGKTAQASNDKRDLLISNAPIPENLAKDARRQNVDVVQPKVEVLDASMRRMLSTYEDYAVNGIVQVNTLNDPRTGRPIVKKQTSFLVEIPAVQPSLVTGVPAREEEPPMLIGPLGPLGGSVRGMNR